MSNPLSNPRISSWSDSLLLGTKKSRGWIAGLVLFALLAGGISLAALNREAAGKSEASANAPLSSSAKSALAKAPEKPEAAPAAKEAAAAHEERGASAEPRMEEAEPAAAKPKTQAEQSASNAGGKEPAGEHESADLVFLRDAWFHDQRAYPNKHIPAGALQKAIEQRDLMRQQQRAALKSGPGAQNIINFPGDALWHLMGPAPENNPFGQNGGAPTASGRVTAIAVDPTNSSIVYIGAAAGGVWKTTNGGTTWTPLTDSQPALAVGSIAIDPNSCGTPPCTTIYVGTGEANFNGDAFYGAGILKSTNGGTTWTQLGAANFAGPFGSDTGGAQIGSIAVQPGNSSNILATAYFFDGNDANGGVWVSTDGGTTWGRPVSGAKGSAGTSVFFESSGTNAWAALGDIFSPMATSNGIWKSTDSGQHWTLQAGGLPTTNVGRITLAYGGGTGSSATVYAAIASTTSNSSNLLGLFKTTNGGTTSWTSLTGPAVTNGFCAGQCFYDMAIGVSPTNANLVVLGGGAGQDNLTSLFQSSNGGTSWSAVSGASTFTNGNAATHPHVDTHAIVFSSDGSTLYVGNDGGIWSTANPATVPPTWADLNPGSGGSGGLAITQFYPGPTAAVSDENFGFGGTQDNDIEKFENSLTWTNEFVCGDGGFTAIDQTTPTTIYGGCNITSPYKITRSTFNGELVNSNPSLFPAETLITSSGEGMLFIPPVTLDGTNPNFLYFGTCRVWQANDAATSYTPSWVEISADLTGTSATCAAGQFITSMDVAHQSSDIVFAGTSNGKVWRSLNATSGAASTWTEFDNSLLPNRHITAVRTERSDSTGNIAFVTFSGFGKCAGCDGKGHVFATPNGGTTWSDISGDLPDIPVNDIIVDHSSSPAHDALYIATDVGVFGCPNPTAAIPCQNWTVLGDGLPNSPVLGLTMRRSSRILRAATHGRSMWDLQLTDVNPPALASISSITPAAVNVGAATTAVTIYGVNFSSNTQVQFAGSTTGVTTTFTNTTQLAVTLNSTLLQTGGVFPITITDPAGVDSGSSFPLGGGPFAVMDQIAFPISMTPSVANTYTAVPITVNGSAGFTFYPNTVLEFYNTTNPLIPPFEINSGTVSNGGQTFSTTTPVSTFTSPATYHVVPFNPTPGGGIDPNALSINGGNVPFTLTVSANPNPVLLVSPNPITLTTALGTTSTVLTVTISNPGGASLNITAQSITGTNATNFSFAMPGFGTTCNFPTSGQSGTGTITLSAGTGTCNFGITYSANTPPGNAESVATLNITDNAAGSPQAISIIGVPTGSGVVLLPVNFGAVPIGATSATMDTTLFNTTAATVNVNATGFTIGGTNAGDFHFTAANTNACPSLTSFALGAGLSCDVGLNFTPSVAGAENATVNANDDATGSPQSAPLTGAGVQISSISPSIVATGGPAFTLTVTGGGFVSSAVVNVNSSARLTTFVSATQLLASIPASDITTAGSLAITVTSPSTGTPSEPKTLVVAQASPATNDSINFPTVITFGTTPFRITQDTTQATPNTSGINDPATSCGSNSVARSVWFKFTPTANGTVVADTRYSSYTTILSAWTGTPPAALTAVAGACATGNIPVSGPQVAESFIRFPVTSGTAYYIMVTDTNTTGAGGTLNFDLDFGSTAPANDPFSGATIVGSTPFSNTENTILATANTGATDPTPSCAPAGAASGGMANSVWYTYTPASSGTITADTLTSTYDTILTVVTGSPGSFTAVACNDNATVSAVTVLQSQVSFAATSGTQYFFMVSSVLGDGGTTNFHLTFTGGAGNPVPTLTSISPTTATALGAAFPLTLTGANFIASSTVNFGANPALVPTTQTSTSLQVTVPASDILVGSIVNVTVTNPAPGGGTSAAQTFTIDNPATTLSSLVPSSVNAGSAGFQLVINGSNFVSTATGTFNGNARTITYVSSTQVQMALLTSDLTTAGSFAVAVSNPAPAGGTNGALLFTVNNLVPTITTISPTSAVVGGATFNLTVTGTNYISNSAVKFNGTSATTTFNSATQLTASISSALIATIGTYPVTVTNPTPGGGTSNSMNFNVTAGTAAKLAFTVQPTNVTAGASISPAVQVTVQDASGNTVTTSTASITMAISNNAGGGTLGGTLTVAAVNGIATFSTLSINKTGAGYTLGASSSGLTSATSTAFNVTAGTASKLAFTTQPSNVAAGASITPSVVVTVQDAQGNTVTSSTASITMAIGTNPTGGTLGGTLTVAAVNGVATFSNLNINKTGTGYTLSATSSGLTTATSTAFNVTPGAANRLVFTTQPTTVAAGSAIAPAVVVIVEDALGNTVTSSTATVAMSIGTNPGGSTLSGTTSVSAVAGVATFSNLSLNVAGTGYTLSASSSGLTSAVSSAFNVTSGSASKLAFTVQPTGVGAGSVITPAVQVSVEDALGNVVASSTASITVAIGTNPSAGTLGGTLTVAASSGVAIFNSLSINNSGNGYTLSATSSGLTTGTSVAFNVTSGTPAKLGFVVQPSNVGSGAAITPPVQVAIQDAQGNTVTSSTANVTMAIGTNPSAGTLSGTLTVAAVSGIATFSTLSINNLGMGYTLTASSSGLTSATSNAFNVTAGAPAKVVFSVQPSNVASGASITPAVQVSIEDAGGNLVTTATNMVTIAIGTNPSSGTLSGTKSVAAVAGVATFSTLNIDKAGTGYTLAASATGLTGATSIAFNVTPGTAAQLVFTAEPTNVASGASITPAVQVTVEDAAGNPITTATNSITIAISNNPSSGTLSGTLTVAAVSGIASFSTLSIDKAGTAYTLAATATGLTTATSSAFNVIAGAASKLAFTVQPSNVSASTSIAPPVQVSVEDAAGNVVTSATNSIAMAISNNPSGGTLSGTTPVAAVNGVATFSNLSIDKLGVGYTLAASATGLTGATSSAFNITAGAPAKLAFTVQPTNEVAGAAIAPAVQVSVEDAGGNVVTTATNAVTIAIGTNPATGTLSGTLTVSATAGVASFSTLKINKAGTGYTLAASATGLTNATSTAFNVTAGLPATITATSGSGQAAVISTAFTNPLVATVTDANANPVSGALVTFTAPGSGASGTFAVGGNTATTNASGVATSGTFTANATAGGPYNVVATVTGVVAGANFALTNNNPVPVITPPLSPASTTALGPTFTLTINGSNFIAGATVSFGSNPALTPITNTGSQITVSVPAADIATGGTPNVTVNNPAPGGGASNAVAFTINNPMPTLSAVTAAGVNHAAGGTGFTLTATGTLFVSTSVVNFNGKAETTTFVSSTQLTAAIPASDVATAGTVNVTVTNPTPGGGTSGQQPFAVDGYTVAGPGAPVVVKGGQPASFTITVTPTANGFNSTTPIGFTVSGLPAHTTFTFTPPTLNALTKATTTTLQVTTKAGGATPPMAPFNPPDLPVFRYLPALWLTTLLAAILALTLRRTQRFRRYAAMVPLTLVLLAAIVVAGCASAAGTPKGTYQLSVTATSGTLSQATAANSVTLTVQ